MDKVGEEIDERGLRSATGALRTRPWGTITAIARRGRRPEEEEQGSRKQF
jgi:hypothetical protein